MTSLSRIYTTREVADLLHVSPETVRRMYARGDLRASKLGKNLHFSEDDLRDALDGTANRPPARRRRKRAA